MNANPRNLTPHQQEMEEAAGYNIDWPAFAAYSQGRVDAIRDYADPPLDELVRLRTENRGLRQGIEALSRASFDLEAAIDGTTNQFDDELDALRKTNARILCLTGGTRPGEAA